LSRSLVVDASVALKWVITEPGTEEAASLLDEMAAGAVALLAPAPGRGGGQWAAPIRLLGG